MTKSTSGVVVDDLLASGISLMQLVSFHNSAEQQLQVDHHGVLRADTAYTARQTIDMSDGRQLDIAWECPGGDCPSPTAASRLMATQAAEALEDAPRRRGRRCELPS